MKSLAIVIPYYKKKYFDKTISSIAQQTCKDFTLYIGDDASIDSPKEIIDKYKDQIDIVYHRFEYNLGGNDLVSQWERCIELTKGEDWIWLFSDDDSMDEKCVEDFHDAINQYINSFLLYRFTKHSLNIKNGDNILSTYKNGITPFDVFLMDCLDFTANGVTMPEFIFHRNLFETIGIINCPMAWGSDKITWLEYAYKSGNVFNLNSIVHVTYSYVNISGNKSKKMVDHKTDIEIKNAQYIDSLLKRIKDKYPQMDISHIRSMYLDKILYKMKIFPFYKRLFYIKFVFPFIDDINSIKMVLTNLFNKKQEI